LLGELGSKLVKFRVDNERERLLQQQTIADIETKLAGVRTTEIITPAARLPDPVGAGRRTIVALYVLLGMMAGVFAAFIADVIARARTRQPAAGNGAHPEQPEPDVEVAMWESR
jgi:hypothetical protein